jgi:hypothetical protein
MFHAGSGNYFVDCFVRRCGRLPPSIPATRQIIDNFILSFFWLIFSSAAGGGNAGGEKKNLSGPLRD